ncbi:hypothetical protein Q5H92_08425 [Hymenobacter sp. M29]|uniref:Tissue inhibitor of metalloproteinase n=1 Tax=Hymenobacter mellowenesis TaxID=3063995 RepID=A0ABT9A9Z7_9BACT|nr:hypothetical protein [Hymenobacter sp. M29]MDO7846378.1 hypothetical protein [Hymenobacter sp. M29]
MKTLLLTCFLLLYLSGAWACSCISENLPEKQKIAKAHAQASLIFTGRLESVALVEKTDTIHFRSRAGADTVVTMRQQFRQYTFAITQQLKGAPAGATVVVLTDGPGSSCGVSYRAGADFVVFAYAIDTAYSPRGTARRVTPYFTTGLCTRTKELRYAKAAELRQLRRLARQG